MKHRTALNTKDAKRLLQHMAEDPPNPLAKASLERGREQLKKHRLPASPKVEIKEVRKAVQSFAKEYNLVEEASVEELDEIARRERICDAKTRRMSGRENDRINRLLVLRIKTDTLIAQSPDKAEVFEKAFEMQTFKSGSWPPKARREKIFHVVCLVDAPDADLVVGNAYEVIGVVDEYGTLRVIDDSGEEYLYPAEWFVGLVEFVQSCRSGIEKKSGKTA